MNKKSIKKRNSKQRLVDISAIAVAMFFGFLIASDVTKIYSLNSKTSELKQQVETAKENSESLQITVKKLEDNDYLSKFAREKLLYSKENEVIINNAE